MSTLIEVGNVFYTHNGLKHTIKSMSPNKRKLKAINKVGDTISFTYNQASGLYLNQNHGELGMTEKEYLIIYG